MLSAKGFASDDVHIRRFVDARVLEPLCQHIWELLNGVVLRIVHERFVRNIVQFAADTSTDEVLV